LSGDGRIHAADLSDGEIELFLSAGLDRANQIEILRQISLRRHEHFRVPLTFGFHPSRRFSRAVALTRQLINRCRATSGLAEAHALRDSFGL
jgi:hypothetical protein